MHWQYAQGSIASSSTNYNVTPEAYINDIYEDIKENVLAYGFTLVTYERPGCNKSTDPKYIQFEIPQVQHNDETVIVTIVLRIATYKAGQSNTYTVAKWFDVAGIIKETDIQLYAFVAIMLGRLSEGNLDVIQGFPKHSTKKIGNNSYSTIN